MPPKMVFFPTGRYFLLFWSKMILGAASALDAGSVLPSAPLYFDIEIGGMLATAPPSVEEYLFDDVLDF